MTSSTCVFCKIVRGELPACRIAETARSLAFMDISPLSPGHVLVIPKTECKERFSQLSPESVVDLSLLMHKVTQAIDPHGEQPYNILNNNGKLAHQMVMHVHFHVIPKRVASDGLGLRWNQLDMTPEDIKNVAKEFAMRIQENERALEEEAKSEETK